MQKFCFITNIEKGESYSRTKYLRFGLYHWAGIVITTYTVM